MSYIPFPNISPEIFSISLGPVDFALRWYALAYLVGLIAGWKLIIKMVETPELWRQGAPMKRADVDDLLTWVILGVILGGRAGYVLFYQPGLFLEDPTQIFRIWNGGMSFHGGFLGVVIAGLVFCQRRGLSRLAVADLMAAVVPIGILLGRVANFINAELWGRPTTLPWGVAFPGEAAQACTSIGEVCVRHPSQIYEAILEGLIPLLLFSWLVWRRGALKWPGFITGLFFVSYGLGRFIVEFFRQPDSQFVTENNPVGYYLMMGDWGLTAGQILSLPMLAVGIFLVARAPRRS